MEQTAIIGIDVGGTNTDAVLIGDGELIGKIKVPSTQDKLQAISDAISQLLVQTGYAPEKIQNVHIGTTFLINSLLQHQVSAVGVIRIGAPATTALPPLSYWPKSLVTAIGDNCYIIEGGYQFDGSEIAQLDERQIQQIAIVLQQHNIKAVAVTGVFAHVNAQQEKRVKALLKQYNPQLDYISLSHEWGGLDLLAREHTCVLDAAMHGQFCELKKALQKAANKLQLHQATLYFSGNDGTLELLTDARPMHTYNSGAGNSVLGASALTTLTDAIIVDIGGTTSDFSIIEHGLPKKTQTNLEIYPNIECSFLGLEVRSIALGGGSVCQIDDDGEVLIGPHSIGYQLARAQSFGGDVLTLLDIANCKGRMQLGCTPSGLNKQQIEKIDQVAHDQLVEGIVDMLPYIKITDVLHIVLVGGGASLFDQQMVLKKCQQVLPVHSVKILQHGDCANAIGAALPKVKGYFSKNYFFTDEQGRLSAIADAKRCAREKVINKNGDAQNIIYDINETPLKYIPDEPCYIQVSAIAPLNNQQATIAISHQLADNLSFNSVKQYNPAYFATETPTLSCTIKPSAKQQDDIDHLARGCAFLGCGGGGNVKIGSLLVKKYCAEQLLSNWVAVDELADDAIVVATGIYGAPAVLSEKLPSEQEIIDAIILLEKKIAKPITHIIPVEIGGMNGLITLYFTQVAAKHGRDIKVINGDYMGRAYPELQMITPNIAGVVDKQYCQAVLADGNQAIYLSANDLKTLENKARIQAIKMGMATSFIYLPMPGAVVKTCCIRDSLSLAVKLGAVAAKEFNAQKLITVLNNILKPAHYGEARIIAEGKIVDVNRLDQDGFSLGVIKLSASDRTFTIYLQNEFLGVYDDKVQKFIAGVPDMITLLHGVKPLSCGELRVGQAVKLLVFAGPEILYTKRGLQICGPQAFDLNKIVDVSVTF